MNFLEKIIFEEVKKQFGQPPKMGDIHPTDEPNRPGMKNRPKDGMSVKQHKDMMWINECADTSLPGALQEFCAHAQKELGITKPVTIRLRKDEENSKDLFGFTGHYSPEKQEIVVFTSGRHAKDVLRSVAHELVHHLQFCRGDFDHELDLKEGYAQTDPHMRKMEEEAFLKGNMLFRDWCDHIKEQRTEILDEINAVGGGGIVGYTGPLGMDTTKEHDMMWSGDKQLKKEERIKKTKHGPDLFQMGGSLPDELYNRKNGKPSRDPGVMQEAAASVEQLPKGTKVEIGRGIMPGFKILIKDPAGKELGELEAQEPKQKCGGAYIVAHSKANKGFGPLLYDLAMEYAGNRGVTADRDSVSGDASNVWKFYHDNRNDVKKVPIDPDECSIDSSKSGGSINFSFGGDDEEKIERPWLNFIYYYDGGNLEKLKQAGMLEMNKTGMMQEGQFYHGSTADLKPGDYVLPPKQTGRVSEKGRKKNLDKVFFTSDVGSAKIYAGRAKHSLGGNPSVYLIKPIGDIHTIQNKPGSTVFASPKAKVIKKL